MIPALFYSPSIGPPIGLLSKNNGSSITTILFLCPAFFSIAHIHHMYEKIKTGHKFLNALFETIIQATYTYIFGYISAILFSRTDNICSCIISHIICNLIGLPNIGFMMRSGDNEPDGNEYSFLYAYRYILLLLHGLGLLLFFMCIYPMTSDMALTSIYWEHHVESKFLTP
jgi:prenyl protein peptidase